MLGLSVAEAKSSVTSLEDMSNAYQAGRKKPVAFIKKHIPNKTYAKDLTKLIKKYKIRELLPAKFGKDSITFKWKGKTVKIEDIQPNSRKIKLNSYELTIDMQKTAKEQVEYISRVLRKTGYASLFSLLIEKAHAENDPIFEINLGVMFGWFGVFGSTSDKILDIRNQITNTKNTNHYVQVRCEPPKLVMEDGNGRISHEVALIRANENSTANSEYHQVAQNARRLGLLSRNEESLSIQAKSRNLILSSESYSFLTAADLDGDEVEVKPSTKEVGEDSLSVTNRLDDEVYLKLGELLHTCCAEDKKDCVDKINDSRAGSHNNPSGQGSQ